MSYTKTHQPCPDCGSSDGLAINQDGSSKCYVCGVYKRCDDMSQSVPLDKHEDNTHYNNTRRGFSDPISTRGLDLKYIRHRGISEDTMKKYGVVYSEDSDNFYFPYQSAAKVRPMEVKKFWWEGDTKSSLPLFGMDKFSAGSAKAITITEGEFDAMAVYEMLGDYPVVSVKSSGDAANNCKQAHDYLNSFEKIYLCLDADKPGQDATLQILDLFNVNKVYVVKLDPELKDANNYLEQNKRAQFTKTWWAAKKHKPANIIDSFDQVREVLFAEMGDCLGEYPFPSLQEMTFGLREGEMVLIKAPHKIGKTEFIRAIEYHILKTTKHPLGVIHLEESQQRAIQGLLAYEYKEPLHLPTCSISKEEQMTKYMEMVGSEGRLHFYKHFGSDDPDDILSTIRYLVQVCGCKFIFLDHISQLVSAIETDDERRKLDYICTKLSQMVDDLKFCLIFISHVNDLGQTRGSRYIEKVPDLILYLQRDRNDPDPIMKNTTKVIIEGNRFAGMEGEAGELFFDHFTFMLREKTIEQIISDQTPV